MFVDEPPSKTKVPVDLPELWAQANIVQPRFFAYLSKASLGRPLGTLQMALGKTPVSVGVFDEERMDTTVDPPEDDPSGTPLLPGSSPGLETRPGTLQG